MITTAGRVLGEITPIVVPAEYIDDVRTVLIDDDSRALVVEIVCAATHEPIALLLEIRDDR